MPERRRGSCTRAGAHRGRGGSRRGGALTAAEGDRADRGHPEGARGDDRAEGERGQRELHDTATRVARRGGRAKPSRA